MKIAVVIGHDKNEPGAYSSIIGYSEYIYNSEVAYSLKTDVDIYKQPSQGSYYNKMVDLAKEVNKKEYDVVVGLHFNNFDNKNNNKGVGTETVIFKGNPYSKKLGDIYNKKITEAFSTKNRGVKERGSKTERGYWFLKLMKAPTIIVEPFFGDEEESKRFEIKKYSEELDKIFEEWKNVSKI